MRTSSQVTFPSGESVTITVTGGEVDSVAATVLAVSLGKAWSAAFTASYVVQLTSRAAGCTAAPIPFADFLAALRATAANAGEWRETGKGGVIEWKLDLLTPGDLEQLRAAKTGRQLQASEATSRDDEADGPSSCRRCLVLTRTRGADRVHYPLPLDPVATAAPARPGADRAQRLRERVDRLRRENAELTAENARLSAGAAEAAELRREAARLGAAVRAGRAKLDERRRGRRAHAAEAARVRAEVADLRAAERATRHRLAEAEAALAGLRAAGRHHPGQRRARSLERRPLSPSPSSPPPLLRGRSPRAASPPASLMVARRPPPPLPVYADDIAEIDKRLEQLRCYLDRALLVR